MSGVGIWMLISGIIFYPGSILLPNWDHIKQIWDMYYISSRIRTEISDSLDQFSALVLYSQTYDTPNPSVIKYHLTSRLELFQNPKPSHTWPLPEFWLSNKKFHALPKKTVPIPKAKSPSLLYNSHKLINTSHQVTSPNPA